MISLGPMIEPGIIVRLTNSYCLIGINLNDKVNRFYEKQISRSVCVVNALISGTSLIGRLCVGNKSGVLVPHLASDHELLHIRNLILKDVIVKRIDEKLSALGNTIATNDYTALIHPDMERQTEEILTDILKVDVCRVTVGKHDLIGTYCCITNEGGMVPINTALDELEDLSALTQIAIAAGTVNRGSIGLGTGLVVNDWVAFCGLTTSSIELQTIESVFRLKKPASHIQNLKFRRLLLEKII